ncbi:sugar phosphate nucleotidyltransferase [Streptomyces sp. NBC_00663]|uniref:nucleotidyltransferase family protein n=1 Tax=Streptomyces sp. NBC_00663 TaxID=2975801 RepID=UPI002E336682|nr:sugar phosphate nucleotidyltransferase [Streptomyces sp. NBC_00663]
MHAIVLAGGKGSRLRPYAAHRPKALVEFGDHSILEIIVRQLRTAGATRVTLCLHHLGEMIQERFSEGRRYGLSIDYTWDETPLGTAAPLLDVADWETPAVVLNCDVLTSLDFADLYRRHQEGGGVLTVACRKREIPLQLGVLDLADGGDVLGIREKPVLTVDVSTGIHVADPAVRKFIPEGQAMDMPDLITALIDEEQPVRAHEFEDSWYDIGTPENYEDAKKAFLASPSHYLGPRSATAGVDRGTALHGAPR